MKIEEKVILKMAKKHYPFIKGINIEYVGYNIRATVDIMWHQFKQYYNLTQTDKFENAMDLMGGSISVRDLPYNDIDLVNNFGVEMFELENQLGGIINRTIEMIHPNKTNSVIFNYYTFWA